jgi:hypothetical protein
MRSTKRPISYLLGAGLLLSVAAFARPTLAQDSGTNGATAEGTSPSTVANSAASPAGGASTNNGAVTPPSGPTMGSDKATSADPATDPDPASNTDSMNSSAPGSSTAADTDSTKAAP